MTRAGKRVIVLIVAIIIVIAFDWIFYGYPIKKERFLQDLSGVFLALLINSIVREYIEEKKAEKEKKDS